MLESESDRNLSLFATRVVGALIEKKITTPDQYPLSLNALVNACNQKSNRDPVMNLDEGQVQAVVDDLSRFNLVSEVSIGSRVSKYQHRFCNTEFSKLHLPAPELAIICGLFLRGPQTPGELRTRCSRLYAFKDVNEVDSTLQELSEREDGPLVKMLVREPGKRESRFVHLFSELSEEDMLAQATNVTEQGQGANTSASERIAALEEQIQTMQADIDLLKQQWEELNS